MVSDVTIKAKFVVNDGALKKAFVGIDKLNKKFSKQTSEIRKLKTEVNSLNKRFGTASQKVTTLNSKLKSATGKMNTARAATKRLNTGLNNTRVAARNASKGLGITGIAFAAIGGMAGMALQQMRMFFETMVGEGGTSATKMQKAIILAVDKSGKSFKVIQQEAIKLQNITMKWANEYPVALDDILDASAIVSRATGDMQAAMIMTPEILRMMTIETVDAESATNALIVVWQAFGDEVKDISKLNNMMIATSLSTKAKIDDLTKSLGFFVGEAKYANLSAAETFGILGTIIQSTGTKAGSSGRHLAVMMRTLDNVSKMGPKLEKGLGIKFFDGKKVRPILDIIDDIRIKYNELLNSGDEVKAKALIEALGFGALGGQAFRILLETDSTELRQDIKDIKSNIEVDNKINDMKRTFDAQMQFMKNNISFMQMSFASGLLPALTELSGVFKTLGQDKEFLNTIEKLAKVLGSMLVPIITKVAGIMTWFVNIMKENPVILYGVAAAIIAIAGALALISVVAPVIGTLIFISYLMTKYPERFKLATKAINKFKGALSKLGILKRPLDISLMLKGLQGKLLRAGVKGAAFFTVGFKIVTKALLSAGAWIITAFGKLAIKFIAGGAAIGAVFSGAFKVASSAILVATGWLEALFIRLALAFGLGGMASGLAFGGGVNKGIGKTSIVGAITGLLARLLPAGVTSAAFASGLGLAGTIILGLGIGLYGTTALLGFILPEFMEDQKRKMRVIWGTDESWDWLLLPFWNMHEALLFRILPGIEHGWISMINKMSSEVNKLIAVLNLIPGVNIKLIDMVPQVPSTKDAEYEAWKSNNVGGMSLKDWKAKYIPGSNKTNSSGMQDLQSVNEDMTIQWSPETLGNQQTAIKENTLLINSQNTQLTPLIENTGLITNLLGNQSSYLNLSFEMLGKQIIQIARNSNMLSLLTTRTALVDVMWAKLVAEGNKAARRIASLTVSKKGVFSMSGGSISAGDQAEINSAQANYNAVKAGQNIIDIAKLTGDISRLNQQAISTSVGGGNSSTQKNNINVSPTIVIPQGSSVNVDDLVKKINEQTKKELAKYLGGISG